MLRGRLTNFGVSRSMLRAPSAQRRLGNSSSTLNQVWQEGPVSGNTPGVHPTTGANVQSMETVNLHSGQTGTVSGGSNSMERKRNIHGVLNAVSQGILLPVGAVVARYVKIFSYAPAWFYLHASCDGERKWALALLRCFCYSWAF